MKLVVDTSILIDYLRGGTKWQEFLVEAPRNAEVFLPTIVIFELFSGKSTKNTQVSKQINNLIAEFQIIELNGSIAQRAGELNRDIGSHITPQDYIIAAAALDINGQVLTLNKKHFEKIPGIKVYPI